MLALTECHASKHGGVRALVLGSPVVDWTAMYAIDSSNADDAAPPADKDPSTAATRAKSRRKKPPPADSWRTHDCGLLLPASALLLARAALFATPEHYHDPFASPLLFFRSASSAIPQPPAASALFNHFLPSAPAASPAAVTAFLKPRRAHLRYPPLGSALVLPRSRIDVGRHSVLRDQGVELAEAMGRSWALYGGRGAGGKAGVEMAEGGEEGAGVENVEVWEGEGEGLWGEEQLVSVGRWVAETLGPGA
ncbi:hypothetical protein MMC26_001151 [Xylographa opegraphella]|nr:hypothetical protein [Xylographa opegraphella]